MTNLLKSLSSFVFLFIGYVWLLVSQYIIPETIEASKNVLNATNISDAQATAAANVSSNVTIGGIIWLGIVLSWIIGSIIIPAFVAIEGIRTPTEQTHMMGIASAIIMFILGVAVIVGAYWILPNAAGLLEDTMQKGIFWVGVIINIALVFVVAPWTRIVTQENQ